MPYWLTVSAVPMAVPMAILIGTIGTGRNATVPIAVPMQCRCSADHKCPSALLKALLTNGFEGKVTIVPILLGLQMLQLGRRL
jgi:hypothetical protein